MSTTMNEAKEKVEQIIKQLEAGNHPSKSSLLEKLNTIVKLIMQNQDKIWLRTRSGKPMAEKLLASAAESLELDASGLDAAIDVLLEAAKEIDDETQRRSMVVT